MTNEISGYGILYRIVCMILLLADIAIGWYSYYQMREDIGSFNKTEPHEYCTENRIDSFWKLYVGFESFATFFKVIQLYQLWNEILDEIKQDPKYPFIFVLLSYSAEIGSAITTIIFMQFCECNDLTPSNWTVGKADFVQKFVSGTALVMLQLLIHATSIINKCRSIRNVVGSIIDDDQQPDSCMALINVLFFVAYLFTFAAEIYFAFCS